MHKSFNSFANPAAHLMLMAQMARIGFESQAVIAMRLAGMMGLTAQSPTEPLRMVTEKQQAVMESAQAAYHAIWRGEAPGEILSDALRPYGRRTRANSRRLYRVKPKRRG
ncbi:MAG: antibiotic ABC transporter [Paracoccus sp. (in: a-proteobacteria)]|uniref:antibiotic ABC transporter n=1 Tax=Paracoccus sp. TaxID=267 RepID=UPI0026E09F37|nr:antibiotic ABC transporter [Paracoccus sp. (in: a-proteobacteria)]MDO5632594.1 antibiotic ABC transporter [Paracoccus sp. (in: a-proteobacteria)]